VSTSTLSAPCRQRKPRPKPERRIRLMVQPVDDCPAVVRITVGTEPSTDYFVYPVPGCSFGRGFQVVKIGFTGSEEEYQVNVGGGPYDTHLCTCKGFERWGHCKHGDGMAALVKAGKL
jgi:hypothetical protein